MIAAAYIRVSTDRQDEYSPDSQLKLIREFGKKHDIDIPEEYVFFDDGISAKSVKKRTAFNTMIALAKEKNPPFEAILVWKFSRFARNQEESIVYKNILKKKNIQVISISEPIIDSPFGELIERIIEWMDEYYLINLSTEVKRGMAEKLQRGEALCPPAFGYNIVNKNYIPNPEQSVIVQEIFQRYVSGETILQIVAYLNSRNVKTIRGNEFQQRSVKYILKNPVYVGKIRWSKNGRQSEKYFTRAAEDNTDIVDGIHQPIISQDLWSAAQARLKDNEKKYQRYQRSEEAVGFALKGLMRCSSCGRTLVRNTAGSLQCHGYTHGLCHVSHSITINKATSAVVQFLKQSVNDRDFNFTAEKRVVTAIDYDSLIKKEKLKLDRAKQAYLAEIDSIEEYKANKAKITKAIKELEKEQKLVTQPQHIDIEAKCREIQEVIDTVENPDTSEAAKNEALRSIISNIIYKKPDNTLDIFFHQ